MPLFPVQSAPFIGRQQELAEINSLLANPDCRLLTLVGPGGIGKTRLALEAARKLLDNVFGGAQGLAPLPASSFSNGVYLVPLQPLTSPEYIVPAIAEALNFQFYTGGEPKQQLLNFLREKSLLLLLDNFEHLLDGLDILTDLLACAVGVKILTTSRERLNLREEWVLNVEGLAFPSSDTDTNIGDFSAVQLFLQNARRVQVGFNVAASQNPAVTRICRLVGGMPLGIELAAAWVRVLSVDEIASEIERSLDILETPARNTEPRHRTMRAAFEPTWNRLTEDERTVYMKLSVFRGGFMREAAEYVAGASLRTLSSLLDKSLLRVDGNGRYDLHELLRQYAAEKLDELPAQQEQVSDSHCTYYADFIGQWTDITTGISHADMGRKEVLASVRQEIENVRAAFWRTITNQKLNQLDTFLHNLAPYYEVHGWPREGAEAYHLAAESLRNAQQLRLLGFSLSCEAWFEQYLLNYAKAHQLAQESIALLLPFGKGLGLFNSYRVLCFIAADNTEARQLAHKALECAQEINNYMGVVTIHNRLSQLSLAEGEYEEALRLSQKALALCRKHNYRWGEIFALQRLSEAALVHQQDFNEAKRLAHEALTTAEAIGSRHGIAWQNLMVGDVVYAQHAYSEAQQHYQQSLNQARELGDPQNIILASSGLGRVAGRLGNTHEAREHFHALLSIAHDTQNVDIQLTTIAGIADLMAAEDDATRAVELLAHCLQIAPRIVRYRFANERLRSELEAALSPEDYAAAWERGTKRELSTVIVELLAEFSQPAQYEVLPATTKASKQLLTERELEILHLVADGLSNREIADQLAFSVNTVKWYAKEIFSKLHVSSRTQAVTRARELGLLS
jgi:predicted ATPase/DNA-binding NarL/FixJ family response regulator